MGATSQKLTALAVKNAKPGKHFDGGGLYVEVTAKGGRRWYLKYRRPDGRENRLSLGAGLSLSDARALIREGLDPAAVKAEQKTKAKREAEGIFPKVAEAWLAYDNKECQWAPETLRKAEYIVRQYLPLPCTINPLPGWTKRLPRRYLPRCRLHWHARRAPYCEPAL